MVTHRLQAVTPGLTWRMLCESLRCPTVARNDVAEDIEDKIKGIIIKGQALIAPCIYMVLMQAQFKYRI